VTDGERRLQVGALARVEGEGALHVVVREGRVERADLKIYEPPVSVAELSVVFALKTRSCAIGLCGC